MQSELELAFGQADLTQLLRALERNFPGQTFSLRSLFRDEQHRILQLVLASTLGQVEQAYASIYEQQAPLMRYLASLGQPVPHAFRHAAALTLGARIRSALLDAKELDLAMLAALVREAEETGLSPQGESLRVLADRELARHARDRLARMVRELAADPGLVAVEQVRAFTLFLQRAGLSLDHAEAQDEALRVRALHVAQTASGPERDALRALLHTLGVADESGEPLRA